ncbi:pyridoxal 5'-phosphate synthase [Actinotalea sp. AC32]|nr:pyridoxal 5'-phosphate synthase [Actinotalea sp. AC32]
MTDSLTGDETLELPEMLAPPADPMPLVLRWLAAAEAAGVREPRAATLATTDGVRVSSRTVFVRDVGSGRVVVGTHTRSRKARDLAAVPYASLTFYWRETLQQVTLAGPVTQLPDDDADALFTRRTREAQAAAVVSRQGEPLVDEQELRDRLGRLVAADGEIGRPPDWTGYAITPDRVELWHGRRDRLHRRLAYEATADGWAVQRLQP